MDEGNAYVRITVRPVTSPLPIAFAGLLIASTVVAGYELGFVPRLDFHDVGWVVLAVPVPLQLLAAAWAFVARSPGATTGAAILAATWLGVALTFITGAPGKVGPSSSLGLFLVACGAAMLVPTLAELRSGALLPAAVTATTTVRFVLAGVSGFTHTTGWSHASGYCGLVLAAVALYAALALELEGTKEGALLPVFRIGNAQKAMDAPLAEQLATLEHEPGVRRTV